VRQFSPSHLAALAILVVASVASVRAARRARSGASGASVRAARRARSGASGASVASARPSLHVETYARILALLVLAAWVGEYVADAINGTYAVKYTLPLQLTDAVSATAVIALWTRWRLAVELLYFWALSASLQAILTPDLGQSFPSVYYFTYFVYHIGAVVAALMLVLGCGLYPRRLAYLRVFGATLVWAAIAAVGDLLTHGNYMYLRAKPIHNSLLNIMGPWPWYIASTAALALAMLLALQLLADYAQRYDRRPVTAAPTDVSFPQ
jgi:hypothetical integral membrane protein (TIGR02206 family)